MVVPGFSLLFQTMLLLYHYWRSLYTSVCLGVGQRRNGGRTRVFCSVKETPGKPILMSKRSAKAVRTASSSSSQSQPSPKRNCTRLNSDEMEPNEEKVSLRQILDKLANMDDRIEEHFGSLTVEISEKCRTVPSVCVG